MIADVTVIVATFGDSMWQELARHAGETAQNQTLRPHAVILSHGASLQEARNAPGLGADTEWLIFLDADDELDPYYVEAMMVGEGDVRQPATLGVVDGIEDDYPVMIGPGRTLLERNHIVIGAMVRTDLFRAVGGFDGWPVLEDWDLWLKCWRAGAEFGQVPEAIYRVHVNPNSRNQNQALHGRVYGEIRRKHLREIKEENR